MYLKKGVISKERAILKRKYRTKGGNEMTSRNGSDGSQNQGSPKAQHDQEFASELISGNNNKGNEYRSKKGSKSKAKPKQSE
jgi:hypothetical protein